jgi:hypothetical protein
MKLALKHACEKHGICDPVSMPQLLTVAGHQRGTTVVAHTRRARHKGIVSKACIFGCVLNHHQLVNLQGPVKWSMAHGQDTTPGWMYPCCSESTSVMPVLKRM